jgi:hypothetical protein
MDRKRFRTIFVLMAAIFLFGGLAPAFSQEILATFGFGRQDLDPDKISASGKPGGGFEDDTVVGGFTWGVNVLFVGTSGFAIGAGFDMISDFENGLNIDPMYALGYVYYDAVYLWNFYLGGMMNFIPKPYIHFYSGGNVKHSDNFMTPTLVGGIDFGGVVVGAQLGYMIGIMSGIRGFKYSITVGVNVGNGLGLFDDSN